MVVAAVEERVGTGSGAGKGRGHVPFTPDAKKALELALREAINLKHDWIGTEHVLLGLLHTETGAAHHILTGRGVTLAAARTVVDEMIRGRKAG
jgi:ATP-dependent Clp protease ATP-binding subunit ClpA